MDAESMVRPKVSTETVLGNAVAVVAAALLPGAVVGVPVLRAMLLPGAVLHALPFLGALGRLIAPLLLGVLFVPLLGLPLRLLGVLRRLPGSVGLLPGVLRLRVVLLPLRLLRVLLRPLLLCMVLFGPGLLVLALFLFGMVLLFALLLPLCVSGSSDSESQ